MNKYTLLELKEAKRAIDSTIKKCEKSLPKLKDSSPQQTLLTRRIEALIISVNLIEKEISNLISYKNSTILTN